MSPHLFDFHPTPLAGLYEIERKPLQDPRGFFSRFFCSEEFKQVGFEEPILQINHSLTRKSGTVRGMHYQNYPHAETKIVSCIQGEVADVVVDIRQGSPTFLQWHMVRLSSENKVSLLIPKGFAHGFQTVTDDCQLLYLHTARYNPESEAAVHVNDPLLNIQWPLRVTEISTRDRKHPMLDASFDGVCTG